MNVVIIGATQGLGLALTDLFLKRGHHVAAGIVERQMPPAIAGLKEKYGESLCVFQGDVTNEDEIAQGVQLCKERFGEIDSLCNVAGVILSSDRETLIQNCVIADLRKTLDVNTVGPVIICKHFYPLMRKGGSIFTVTSEGVNVKNNGTWIPCYGLSKTAATKVPGLFNAAIEDVDFYAVHPGRMNTEMGRTTAQIEPEESAEGFYKLMTGETPISRREWYIDYKGKPMQA